MENKKVFVLGIDGAPPELIFGKWLNELPNIKKLISEGSHAEVESTIPPLTCAAWTSFSTGKPAADHGLFEYVYRKNHDYDSLEVISAKNIKEKTFWQILSEKGKKSIIFGVPITWPIKPFNGIMVTGFMTPGTDKEYTLPANLKDELRQVLGKEYMIDIENYRKLSKKDLIEKVYEMTDLQFKSIKYLLKNKEWDLFFGVLIGSDRMNHNFWRFFDEQHRNYEKNEFSDTLKNYYIYLDKEIGEILSLLDKDTSIILASDHGTTRMHNRVNLSDWLIKEGYLVLKTSVKEKSKLDFKMIDWEKTKAFAIGAFEGQIYLNLKGREPKGIVKEEEDSLIKEIEEKIKKITGDDGKKLETHVFTRKKHYDGKARDIAPDLIVYFDNLQYGCNTSLIGNETLWSPSTALGSDDAVHSRRGIFIIKDNKTRGKQENMKIEEIANIILNKFNLKENNTIICTIGPASESEEILKKLKYNGMSHARINLSHVESEDAKKLIDKLSSLEIPIILDTRGREIRISLKKNIQLNEKEILKISDDDSTEISFSREGIIKSLSLNQKVFIDDEKIILNVNQLNKNSALFSVVKGGELKNNRMVKINPAPKLNILTDEEEKIIFYGIQKGINALAISFTESPEDIKKIKAIFPGIKVIPKIENMPGVINIDEIIKESDAVWIDRFDLGTFIGFEKVPLIQKMIIKKCRANGKQAIIASHLLESMVKEGNPTRAEINDIANTILDGATGLVLAAETAIGNNPLKALEITRKMFESINLDSHAEILDKLESGKVLEKLKEIGYV